MLETLSLIVFVGIIVSTLWWPAPVVRVAGALFLGAFVFLLCRSAWGWPVGLGIGLVAAALSAWGLSHRILKRTCFTALSLFLLAFVTTWLMYSVPGSPFASEKQANEQVRAALKAKYGVKDTATEFFLAYVKGVVVDGTLGPSTKNQGRTVEELILPALPVSMTLGLLALSLAVGLGLFLGIRAGLKPNSLSDASSMGLAMVGISIPNFVVGALLMLAFSLALGWLPVAGWGGYGHLFLPAVTLALPYAAYVARLARGGTIEVMQQDFIRTARAKGLPERAVVLKHALKGAILPVVSFLGPAAAGILTGSFVIENLFTIPGMGQWFVKSAINRDYTVVLGCALVYCALITMFNLLVDIAYAFLDPRVREDL